ncbi:hypothetical protein [Paraburkholderia flagellata]|uniref:hypothetical protein n=1 Tax=Paraburkholderia flagellata TaxID=2883241 RepID=UPI001F2FD583|nr:hypothetical protein [Paraburkholderia flagellata]
MFEAMETAKATKAIDLNDRISIYQPTQKDLIFPELPPFANHAEYRQHLRQRLVAACHAFAVQSFD